MTGFTNICILSVALFTTTVYAEDIDEAIDARIDELATFESTPGVWQGSFELTSGPAELLDSSDDDSEDDNSVRIRAVMKENADPDVYLLFNGEDDWSEVKGDVISYQTTLGWTIFIQESAGQWIEKINITFTQLEHDKAAVTYNRTVHNWYITEPSEDVYEFYHVYGVGEVSKHSLPTD